VESFVWNVTGVAFEALWWRIKLGIAVLQFTISIEERHWSKGIDTNSRGTGE